MSKQKPCVVGVGAANFDVSGKSFRTLISNDSNPGEISVSVGGVTHNIIENLARLGARTSLITVAGDDYFADAIRQACEESGIDTRHFLTVAGEKSSCYLNVLDADGEMQVAVSDMRIMRHLTVDYLKEKRTVFEKSDAVVTDGCLLPEVMMELVTDVCRDIPVFADTVSTTYAHTIKEVIGFCHTIKPNVAELEVLVGLPARTDAELERACDKVLESGLYRVVVTLGGRGCYAADKEGRRMFRKLKTMKSVDNVTGAGDAFFAGLIYGTLLDMPLPEMLDFALASGIVAILSVSTINPNMSPDLVRETLELYRDHT